MGTDLCKVLTEPVVPLGAILQLASNDSRMNPKGARKANEISLGEEWGLLCDEPV